MGCCGCSASVGGLYTGCASCSCPKCCAYLGIEHCLYKSDRDIKTYFLKQKEKRVQNENVQTATSGEDAQ